MSADKSCLRCGAELKPHQLYYCSTLCADGTQTPGPEVKQKKKRGRPPVPKEKQSARISLRLTADMRRWVKDKGGVTFIRRLLDAIKAEEGRD